VQGYKIAAARGPSSLPGMLNKNKREEKSGIPLPVKTD
jgi:hypothetical protein